MSIFKAYDIRGIYGDTVIEPVAAAIDWALVIYPRADAVVVRHGMRLHSQSLTKALFDGRLIVVVKSARRLSAFQDVACHWMRRTGAIFPPRRRTASCILLNHI